MLFGRTMGMAGVLVLAVGAASAAISDQDGDGVGDRRDRCADTPIGAKVDRTGCPTDTDADGVADGLDRCGRTPAGWPVDPLGCPRDTDLDGVADAVDACGATLEGATVDDRGCPFDSDADNVPDGLDRCAATRRGAAVDLFGCPIDTDHDGVPNGLDRCPDTRHATPVDPDGCDDVPKTEPIFTHERETVVLEEVTFEKGEAAITDDAARQLAHVAAALLDWPEDRVEIRAYTDAAGPSWLNHELSERRAEVVKAFLVASGVEPARLTARGLGERSPIADNRTPEGRQRNRRIELARIQRNLEMAAR